MILKQCTPPNTFFIQADESTCKANTEDCVWLSGSISTADNDAGGAGNQIGEGGLLTTLGQTHTTPLACI